MPDLDDLLAELDFYQRMHTESHEQGEVAKRFAITRWLEAHDAELLAEVQRLRALMNPEVSFKELHLVGGKMDAEVDADHWLVKIMAASMFAELEAAGPNYVEHTVEYEVSPVGEFDRYRAAVCIVRPGGRTPHQLRQDAEAERDAALSRVAELEAKNAVNGSWLRSIANDLRAAGDVELVTLDREGVAPAAITLADELWLVALRVDGRLNDDATPGEKQ